MVSLIKTLMSLLRVSGSAIHGLPECRTRTTLYFERKQPGRLTYSRISSLEMFSLSQNVSFIAHTCGFFLNVGNHHSVGDFYLTEYKRPPRLTGTLLWWGIVDRSRLRCLWSRYATRHITSWLLQVCIISAQMGEDDSTSMPGIADLQ